MWRSLHNSMPRLRGMVEPHLLGITQSTSALAFNMFGILAGTILAESYGVFEKYKWALLVFPGILSNRGAIGGLFSGRLSTGLHLGTISPSIRDNTDEVYQLFSAVITLTALSALLISSGSGLFAYLTYKIAFWEIVELFLTVFLTLAISILVISPTTFLVSIYAFHRGLDPDMVVYPVTSTTADVSISLIYVIILRLISLHSLFYDTMIVLVNLFFIGFAVLLHNRSKENREYHKTISEFVTTLLVVTVIVTLTGHVLGRISDSIGNTAEIYAIYPAMIDTVGDVGSIIGSTATTKLSLGIFPAEFKSLLSHLTEVSYAWSSSLLLFTVYGIISGATYGFSNFSSLLAVVWWTNLLVIPVIVLVSFMVGIITYRRGLDPDNFVIPFETSLADSLTTIALYLMVLVWY